MFEFTLSKVNMLIFVTAIAVVVIFFMNTLNDNLRTRQSYELAYKVGKEFKSVVDADSYCSIKFIEIPKTIKINEGSSLYTINYKLGFQTYTLENNTSLIIYILDYKGEKILGAYNFDYNGEINFYESEPNDLSYSFNLSSDEDNIIYEPRKLNSNETTLMIIKNIKEQDVFYYVIPCERKNGIYTCKSFVCGDNVNFTLDPDQEITCKNDFCSTMMD